MACEACVELPGLGLAGAAAALQALVAIARGEDQHGIEALAGVLKAAALEWSVLQPPGA